jgi:DNA-directed RNA polymerase beta' subunit
VTNYYASVRGITLGIREYCHRITFDEKQLSSTNERIIEMEKRKDTLTDSGKLKAEGDIQDCIDNIAGTIGNQVKAFLSGVPGDLANISYISGAKGNLENVCSAVASIGQQYEGSERLKIKSNTHRISPYSEIGSKSITDNGFILGSYASGLSPKEVMAQAIPSRRNAFIVYRRTPESGTASRQMCLHLGGIYIDERFRVIGRDKEMLSTLYGIGCDTIYTNMKPSALGDIECPVDWLQVLKEVEEE